MLDGVRDDRALEALAACRVDQPVLHDDPTGVAQCERELLDEERVAFRPFLDDRRDRRVDPRRAAALAGQGERIGDFQGTDAEGGGLGPDRREAVSFGVASSSNVRPSRRMPKVVS